MSESNKNRHPIYSVDQLIDNYQQHPNMLQVKILRDKLKQEKIQDKDFYQSIKEKITERK